MRSLSRCTRQLLLLLLPNIILLFTSCSSTPQLPPLPQEAVILAFGDSITYGTGVGPAENYPTLLEKLIGRRVVNAGVPGEMTAEGKLRLPAMLDEHRPALMILCLGGNDFLKRQNEAETAANLRAMVAMAKQQGVAVVLVAVPKLGFGLEVPKFYREIAKESDLPLEAKVLKKILSDNGLKSDPIHPNATGYRMLAESVAKLIAESGAVANR